MAGILLVMLAAGLWAADTLFRYPLLESNSTLQIVFFEHLLLVLMLGIAQIFIPKWRFSYIKGTIFAFVLIGVFGSASAPLPLLRHLA